MKTITVDQGPTTPSAFVTRGRQRVKQYTNYTVYLNNGEEFEIELYNPTNKKVLAKIELNGVSLGSGIVLRPGERVFLERHLDESRKFIFETYVVDDNNNNRKAIENNGNVVIEFYSEKDPLIPSWTYTYSSGQEYGGYQYNDINHSTPYNNLTYDGQASCFYSQSSSPKKSVVLGSLRSIETGRIEKGSHSKQGFGYDNTSFNSFYSWRTEWKILPTSQKLFESRDLRVFCTSCGSRQKKTTHKFCPICGTRY